MKLVNVSQNGSPLYRLNSKILRNMKQITCKSTSWKHVLKTVVWTLTRFCMIIIIWYARSEIISPQVQFYISWLHRFLLTLIINDNFCRCQAFCCVFWSLETGFFVCVREHSTCMSWWHNYFLRSCYWQTLSFLIWIVEFQGTKIPKTYQALKAWDKYFMLFNQLNQTLFSNLNSAAVCMHFKQA